MSDFVSTRVVLKHTARGNSAPVQRRLWLRMPVSDEIVFPVEDDPVASVIVLAWRSAPLLLDCLRSVEEHVRAVPYELIIVLNEPTSELLATVQRTVVGTTVLRTSVNVGFGGTHNLAARYARGEYMVFVER